MNQASIREQQPQQQRQRNRSDYLKHDLPSDLVEATRVLENRQRVWEQQFRRFDALVVSAPFQEYLSTRGLVLEEPKIQSWPRDYDAEQATLGAMLMGDMDAIAVGLRKLRPHCFKLPMHSVIFLAIAADYRLYKRGKLAQVDIITVCSQLRRMHEFGEEGSQISASYLASLIEACPSSANIEAYISPVLETAKLRSMLELADRLKGAALSPEASPEKLLNIVRNAADAIEQKVAPDLEAIFDKEK